MALEKAKIIITSTKKEIKVQFNPSEYHITSSINVKPQKKPGANAKTQDMQFLNSDLSTFSTTLIFDTYSNMDTDLPLKARKPDGKDISDVREKIRPLYYLLLLNPDKHTTDEIKFSWGEFLFIGRLVSFSENYTMFSEKGIPVKAKVEISISGIVYSQKTSSTGVTIEPFCSPDRTKQRTLKENDNLWAMAYAEYDDPAMWRVIADANRILNPRSISHNLTLKLPSIK